MHKPLVEWCRVFRHLKITSKIWKFDFNSPQVTHHLLDGKLAPITIITRSVTLPIVEMTCMSRRQKLNALSLIPLEIMALQYLDKNLVRNIIFLIFVKKNYGII